jgi:hypothetical protein
MLEKVLQLMKQSKPQRIEKSPFSDSLCIGYSWGLVFVRKNKSEIEVNVNSQISTIPIDAQVSTQMYHQYEKEMATIIGEKLDAALKG